MKNAASIFQKVIESTLSGIPGVIAYQDDVLIFAATEASLRRRMTATRNKLEERGFSINEQKSATVSESISFLGYEISKCGIQPDSRLVSKILAIEPPKCLKELEHFIGMVNFFGRFIPNLSTKMYHLNALKNKMLNLCGLPNVSRRLKP